MSQTFSYARLTCMTVGAALALVRHVHACGTCMLRQMHMCSMCMGAALAWLQHVHGGGICMGAACAWWRHMHECGTCIGATDACLRHCHVGALLASTNREAQRTTHMCMLPPGRGTLASLGASPKSCLQGRHGLKPMPAPPHVGCQGSQHGLCCILRPLFFCF